VTRTVQDVHGTKKNRDMVFQFQHGPSFLSTLQGCEAFSDSLSAVHGLAHLVVLTGSLRALLRSVWKRSTLLILAQLHK
jgi:hypothetical protein